MLFVSVLTTSSVSPGIRIQRVSADSNLLFPANSQRLTRFMMEATYGAVRPFSPAWAQRSVLDATSNSDIFGRLAYYEEARAAGHPRGAVFAAERVSDGALLGFADVGVSLWLPNDRTFRLPQDPDLRRLAATGIGADGQRKPGVELRPYLSNVVVDASLRRCARAQRPPRRRRPPRVATVGLLAQAGPSRPKQAVEGLCGSQCLASLAGGRAAQGGTPRIGTRDGVPIWCPTQSPSPAPSIPYAGPESVGAWWRRVRRRRQDSSRARAVSPVPRPLRRAWP